MDNRKEQERAELHRTIWNIANDLRGSVDGWDFKQYVLGMLFYRYISENITAYINAGEHEAGNIGFDYAKQRIASVLDRYDTLCDDLTDYNAFLYGILKATVTAIDRIMPLIKLIWKEKPAVK